MALRGNIKHVAEKKQNSAQVQSIATKRWQEFTETWFAKPIYLFLMLLLGYPLFLLIAKERTSTVNRVWRNVQAAIWIMCFQASVAGITARPYEFFASAAVYVTIGVMSMPATWFGCVSSMRVAYAAETAANSSLRFLLGSSTVAGLYFIFMLALILSHSHMDLSKTEAATTGWLLATALITYTQGAAALMSRWWKDTNIYTLILYFMIGSAGWAATYFSVAPITYLHLTHLSSVTPAEALAQDLLSCLSNVTITHHPAKELVSWLTPTLANITLTARIAAWNHVSSAPSGCRVCRHLLHCRLPAGLADLSANIFWLPRGPHIARFCTLVFHSAAPNMHVHQDADNNAGTNNEGLKDRDSADDPEGKSGDAIRVVEQNGNRIGKMEEPVATQGETQLGVMTSDSPARSQLSSNGTYKQPKEGQELA
ncbi:hypothetical protein KFL_002310010 [Klebsormidium nitens]|uniref:Uncharacterized protein n=1 Tax=Klebsormidium nitens TaxID=105231 RepID=A0A1Y1I332_KLENI|nr:hypothetical protein KFL_002310010 [Klebsormidium nitens]|eukprot:GAQ85345.1 hypothetical protein KFL_002310010 [Klebsormidium nitens]